MTKFVSLRIFSTHIYAGIAKPVLAESEGREIYIYFLAMQGPLKRRHTKLDRSRSAAITAAITTRIFGVINEALN